MIDPARVSSPAEYGIFPLSFVRFLEASDGMIEARCGEFDSEADWDDSISAALALPDAELLLRASSGGRGSAVIRFTTNAGAAVALVQAYFRHGSWDFDVAGESPAAADAAMAALGILVPPRPPSNDLTVDMHFWMAHPMAGAVSRRKAIPRLPFSDIAANYPLVVRDKVTDLSALTAPPAGGKMLVFHGPPGTGKTKFLHSLADAWSGWCDFHYVMDPEEMFGTALYLNTVLLDGDSGDDRWRVVVIEDGDEFIDVNAKERVGQGVARLLNVADGLIGSGLRVMVLISTNVPSPDFGAAIIRSGRCGALVEFPHFPAVEASAWAQANGLDVAYDGDVSLADLYAQIPAA